MQVTQTVTEIVEGLLKPNMTVELEDTLSCSKMRAVVLRVDKREATFITFKGEHIILTAAELAKYDIKQIKWVYDEEETDVKKELTKKECEKEADEYGKMISEQFAKIFGSPINVGMMDLRV